LFEDAKIQKNIFSHLFWKFSPARRPASRNLVDLVNLFLLASERDLVEFLLPYVLMRLRPVKYDNLILCFSFHNLVFFEKKFGG